MARILVVAGTGTGVGKTSITLGLLEAYRRRGLAVQAFKVGPDFIDPGLHALVTGRPSYNLDGWMCGRAAVTACVARASAGADLAIVEGMMGCFDGVDGASEDGSTAQIAKWLGAPVVLVLDAWSAARSAAATVLGFERFDSELAVAGVIANRVGGDAHGRMIAGAIGASCRAVSLGAIRRDDALVLPERHLGLVTAAEGVLTPELRVRLADAIEASVDLDRLYELAAPPAELSGPSHRPAPGLPLAPRRRSPRTATRPVRIGVARDAAFQFYYAENLDLLREAGAELVFWSPLAADDLPAVDGLYFGGGYPELHARRLAGNAELRKAVRRFVEAGRPVHAECGGLMYLAETLEDPDGAEHPMVGVLPARVRMRPPRMALGYTEVALAADTPVGLAGTVARGHEFHYSWLEPAPAGVACAYRVSQRGAGERAEGWLVGRTLMSYVHLHFASNPGLAGAFVRACAA
jgi:cobyrinic acid a,c-diamide synthase